MSQQEMDYNEMSRDKTGFSSGRYEGTHGYHMYGEKISMPAERASPTAGQRLILAIASLLMLMITIFGLIAIAVVTEAPSWVIIPLLLILVLFSTVAVIINIVFNRKP